MTTLSPLGEVVSKSSRLSETRLAQHAKLLAWTRSRAQHAYTSLRPRLGEPLSPKRDCLSLKPGTIHLGEKCNTEPKMRFCNSRLDEITSLGRDLQSFPLFTHTNHLKSYPNHIPIYAKQWRIIHQTCTH